MQSNTVQNTEWQIYCIYNPLNIFNNTHAGISLKVTWLVCVHYNPKVQGQFFKNIFERSFTLTTKVKIQ